MRIDVVIVAHYSDPSALDRAVESVLTSEVSGRLMVYLNGHSKELMAPGPLAQASKNEKWDFQWNVRLDNRGFCGANNIAANWFMEGGSSYLFIMNPDVTLDPDCMTRLANFLSQCSPAMAGPLLRRLSESGEVTDTIDSAGTEWTLTGRHLDYLSGANISAAPVKPFPVSALTGAAIMLNRACVELLLAHQAGELFDQTFFAYREDAELGLRAAAAGIPMWVLPHAVAGHERQLRGTDRKASSRANRLSVQNRFIMRFKYGRSRPGHWVALQVRDALVVAAVVMWERDSFEGLRTAIAIRRFCRMRGDEVRHVKIQLAGQMVPRKG